MNIRGAINHGQVRVRQSVCVCVCVSAFMPHFPWSQVVTRQHKVRGGKVKEQDGRLIRDIVTIGYTCIQSRKTISGFNLKDHASSL